MAEYIDVSTTSESSEDEEQYDGTPIVRRKRVYRRHVDPFEEYDDFDFRRRFRFTKESVGELVNLLRPDLQRKSTRKCMITPEKQVLLALRYYACGSFQIMTGDSIGVSNASVCRAVTAVSEALVRRMDDHIIFPMNQEAQRTKVKFYDIAGFPNVISAIDCTHVRIVPPVEYPEQYVNRKHYHSLNVQAACDADFKFTNVCVKWPGSAHDSFILQESELWRTMERDSGRGIVVGDSAYPCRFWLMTPFKQPSNPNEEKYNNIHSKTRVVIEQSFGILKKRFNVLHQENRRELRHVAADIGACFVLHNFAMSRKEPIDFEELDDDPSAAVAFNVPQVPPPPGHNSNFGVQRRRSIMNRFCSNLG